MSQVLKEIFSETKKGRPSVLSSEMESLFRAQGLYDGRYSRRSKLNVYYRQRALVALIFQNEGAEDAGTFAWLADGEKMKRSEPHAWRQTILSELGRIEDEEMMRAVATQICELKPKTKDAVLMIRRFRVGELPAADSLQLANAIIQTLNTYMSSHSKMTPAQVSQALATAQRKVDESLSA
jgi:ribosomal protein S18